jgi:4-amino-4-deoxy-L-arabinose transferase-like glycosyltransferase
MSLWQLWWLSLAIKTIILPLVPITPDEAYYFAWARHPDFSYLDHPPFVAWLMTLGIPLWKSVLTVRWPGVVLSHLGYLPWFGILKRLKFSDRAQFYWFLSVLLGPLTGLGSFIITPDIPLMFFWSVAMWALIWTMEKPEIPRWLVVGLAVGLGLLSKYMMVLFFPAALLWLFWQGDFKELKKPGPWVALSVALLLFTPVIYWNYTNHFASFAFQTKHGLTAEDFKWRWPFEFMGSQMGLINPLLLIIGMWVLFQKPWRSQPQLKFLATFAALPFVFFVITSFRARAEANWAVCAFPSFLALVMVVVDKPEYFKPWRPVVKTALTLAAIFATLIITHAIHPWLPIPKEKDHTRIMREWSEDVSAVKSFHPLYARSYQMAAFHSFYRPQNEEVFKLAGLDRIDFYDFLTEAHPHTRGFIILKKEDRIPVALLASFEFTNPKTLPSGMLLFDLIPRTVSVSLSPHQ